MVTVSKCPRQWETSNPPESQLSRQRSNTIGCQNFKGHLMKKLCASSRSVSEFNLTAVLFIWSQQFPHVGTPGQTATVFHFRQTSPPGWSNSVLCSTPCLSKSARVISLSTLCIKWDPREKGHPHKKWAEVSHSQNWWTAGLGHKNKDGQGYHPATAPRRISSPASWREAKCLQDLSTSTWHRQNTRGTHSGIWMFEGEFIHQMQLLRPVKTFMSFLSSSSLSLFVQILLHNDIHANGSICPSHYFPPPKMEPVHFVINIQHTPWTYLWNPAR